ncbi:hypothetical protein [Peribacillus asahii]|uniref:hypothetical protein n=1 Tax=Peribacillus asahii TaxID=228899 RepID=UPI001FE37AAF|nr:hypothetical protein [Peribacillus asahii]
MEKNENEQLVQVSINQFSQGKTVIMIAHRLSTIVNADICCEKRRNSRKRKSSIPNESKWIL